MEEIKEVSTKILILGPWWKDLLFAVLQESVLGPLLSNKFLCNLFLLIKDADFARFLFLLVQSFLNLDRMEVCTDLN